MFRFLMLPGCILLSSALLAQTFTATVNDLVPDDGSTWNIPVEVSGLPTSLNASSGLVQVCLNMDHTYTSDMEVRLIAPDGTSLLLLAGIGGDGDNFTNCCLRFDAAEYVSAQPAPFTGVFLPMGNMSVINNNQDPNGTWYLSLHDTYAGADQGFMYDCSITFDSEAPIYEFPFESTYLPIVFINTNGQIIQDEPKSEAHMRIIYNGPGMLNNITDTDYHYEGDILVELQGFTGPWYPKKNYDFDLIDAFDQEIDTSLLGMPAENDFIFKAEYLDPTLMYNNIAYSFGRKMDRYAPRLQYCEVILDGDYIGVYSLTEKIKRSEERVDIAKLTPEDISGDSLTGGYIIEMNINGDPGSWNSQYLPINFNTCNLPVEYKFVYPRANAIMPEQAAYIQAFVDSFEYILHSSDYDDPVSGYRSKIGVGSFIDFMLVNEMSTNYDSYGRSTFMYKEKNTDGNKLHIGPPWDYDRGFGTIEGWVWEITHAGWPFPDWWSIFHSDSTYVNQAWCRWQELRADLWSDEAFMDHIDSLETYLSEAAIRNYQRWPELGVGNWPQQVEDLRNRLLARLAWMDDNIAGNGPCIPNLVNNSANTEAFESDVFPGSCWTTLDEDGNNQSWSGNIPVAGYDSPHCVLSYNLGDSGEDNYLISPSLSPVDGEHLTWYASTAASNDVEHYQVLLSQTGNAPEDFDVILFEESIAGSNWAYRAADLSAWWGQTVYIAFRHITSSSGIILKLDEVQYPTWTNENQDCSVSVSENFVTPIFIYPNPASTTLYIGKSNALPLDLLRICDAAGNLVMEQNMFTDSQIDIADLPMGYYMLQIIAKDGSHYARSFVKGE